MSPVQMTTLELARECRKFVDHIENKPLPCNDTTGLPKELACDTGRTVGDEEQAPKVAADIRRTL